MPSQSAFRGLQIRDCGFCAKIESSPRISTAGLNVPLYEYQCKKCKHRFEKIQLFSSRPIKKCPECGGPVEKLLSASAVQFKGSGWYVTDYAKKGGASQSSSSESGDGAGKASSGEKSEAKSEAGSGAGNGTGSSSEASSKDSAGKGESKDSKPKSESSSSKRSHSQKK
jgi:putative FmdB family regulatory protein